MPYSPPVSNAVNFTFRGSYTLPTASAVHFTRWVTINPTGFVATLFGVATFTKGAPPVARTISLVGTDFSRPWNAFAPMAASGRREGFRYKHPPRELTGSDFAEVGTVVFRKS